MSLFEARDKDILRDDLIDLSNEVFLSTARELAMFHKSSTIRVESLWEVGETGGEYAEVILCESALKNSDHHARLVAILNLAVEKGPLGETVLWSLTRDQDKEIQLATLVALAIIDYERQGKESVLNVKELFESIMQESPNS